MSFEGLQIKKSRVTEFMKDDCSLSIKIVTRHPSVLPNIKIRDKKLKKTIVVKLKIIYEFINKKHLRVFILSECLGLYRCCRTASDHNRH
jgi:hypothetical protein